MAAIIRAPDPPGPGQPPVGIIARIWSTLGVMVLASQVADGATWSLALVGAQAITTMLVLALSIRFGMGGASLAG
jgi:hypothetical protein